MFDFDRFADFETIYCPNNHANGETE